MGTLHMLLNVFLPFFPHFIQFYSFKYLSVVYTHYAISTKDEFGDDENKETASARIRENLFLQTHVHIFFVRVLTSFQMTEHLRIYTDMNISIS